MQITREILHARLGTYSRSANGSEVPTPADDETIVLVPPLSVGAPAGVHQTLGHGFEEARRKLESGRTVRLVAHGATIRAVWPEWVRTADRLTLTELGAYRSVNPSEETRPLAAELHAWLDKVFEGVVPGVGKAGSVFYSSAAGRLFQPLFDALPYAKGLAAAHPRATIYCTDPDWVGLLPLDELFRATGRRLHIRARLPIARYWVPRLFGHMAYRFARACAGQLRNFARAAPSRRRLARLRQRTRSTDPTIWMAMVPDWKRINRHLVEGVAAPIRGRGEKLGVLLSTTLLPGERFDDALGKRVGKSLWPALDLLGPDGRDVAIEQIVGPESWGALGRMLLRGGRQCLSIAARLARDSPLLSHGPLQLDLSRHLPGLTALATTDVLQSLAAAEAVAAAQGRYRFEGSTVVFASLGYAETATAGAVLDKLDATTVDFVHGAGGDNWYGMTETTASFRAVWTQADAETCRKLGARPLVVALPGAERLPLTRPVGVTRVLVLSNYVHVDTAAALFPLEPFQAELLDGITMLADRFQESSEYRWRPHPCDDKALVKRAAARVPGVELSAEPSLAEDLLWSDIVISSASSTVPQALLTGRPVFVHVHPSLSTLEDVKALHTDRTFFYAEELVPLIGQFLRSLSENPESAMAPERSARAALFGESTDALADLPAVLAAARPVETGR